MRDYACIMLDYEQPEFINEIQKKIPKEDLYLGETENDRKEDMFGIEKESHITICYGLKNNVEFDSIKKCLFPINEYKTILVNISVFENDKFDVLKVDARCPKAAESNNLINDNFKVHSDFEGFHPHMTIAYMKKGKADIYKKNMLDKIEDIKPFRFNYSYVKDGEYKNDFYKNIQS
jgi:hypothetical protein